MISPRWGGVMAGSDWWVAMAGEPGGSDAGQAVPSGLADLLTAAGVFVFGGERWRDGLDGEPLGDAWIWRCGRSP